MQRERGHWQAQKHAHDISQIIWALGCFGHAPSRMPFLLAEAEAALEVSNDMDLTNIIGGLASLEQPLPGSEPLMLKAEQRACHLITIFSPRVSRLAMPARFVIGLPCMPLPKNICPHVTQWTQTARQIKIHLG